MLGVELAGIGFPVLHLCSLWLSPEIHGYRDMCDLCVKKLAVVLTTVVKPYLSGDKNVMFEGLSITYGCRVWTVYARSTKKVDVVEIKSL